MSGDIDSRIRFAVDRKLAARRSRNQAAELRADADLQRLYDEQQTRIMDRRLAVLERDYLAAIDAHQRAGAWGWTPTMADAWPTPTTAKALAHFESKAGAFVGFALDLDDQAGA